MNYIRLDVKSQDEIELTLSHIEYTKDGINAQYKNNLITISNYLWDICSTPIDTAIGQQLSTHNFDYAYLYDGVFSTENQLPYIYLMNDWVNVNVAPIDIDIDTQNLISSTA